MEAIIFIGIQASGKSTFYKKHFFNSHLRISNDLLKTKNRVNKIIDYCTETNMKVAIDNTNITAEVRKSYIEKFKKYKYKIIAYYFKPDIDRSLIWNSHRTGKEIIPKVGILGTYKKLEKPSYAEGFDEIFFVDIIEDTIVAVEWNDEI